MVQVLMILGIQHGARDPLNASLENGLLVDFSSRLFPCQRFIKLIQAIIVVLYF